MMLLDAITTVNSFQDLMNEFAPLASETEVSAQPTPSNKAAFSNLKAGVVLVGIL
jgi:hypothetical protein